VKNNTEELVRIIVGSFPKIIDKVGLLSSKFNTKAGRGIGCLMA